MLMRGKRYPPELCSRGPVRPKGTISVRSNKYTSPPVRECCLAQLAPFANSHRRLTGFDFGGRRHRGVGLAAVIRAWHTR
jgi:hypothetical protein